MLTSDFNYHLPPELIAQTPAEPRDHARLMIIDRARRTWEHKYFYDLPAYLRAGDLLVWNNSKVFKARLRGRLFLDGSSDGLAATADTASRRILNITEVEFFLVRPMTNPGVWKALARPARKLRLGMRVVFADDFSAEVIVKEPDGTLLVQFADDDALVRAKANMYGEVPLPPYIKTEQGTWSKEQIAELDERYQTVYAKHEGSVAAPTAGFHFTPQLIAKLAGQGVQLAEVTLHVGLGTFLPVTTEQIEAHQMHSEWAEVTAKNADLINAAKAEGRRVVAVGTTTVRMLEGAARQLGQSGQDGALIRPFSGDINLFITPGFRFQVVDALITNWHLPQSTLVMLACAFAGDTHFMRHCYAEAIAHHYRFYSFGDAMFIS